MRRLELTECLERRRRPGRFELLGDIVKSVSVELGRPNLSRSQPLDDTLRPILPELVYPGSKGRKPSGSRGQAMVVVEASERIWFLLAGSLS